MIAIGLVDVINVGAQLDSQRPVLLVGDVITVDVGERCLDVCQVTRKRRVIKINAFTDHQLIEILVLLSIWVHF